MGQGQVQEGPLYLQRQRQIGPLDLQGKVGPLDLQGKVGPLGLQGQGKEGPLDLLQ